MRLAVTRGTLVLLPPPHSPKDHQSTEHLRAWWAPLEPTACSNSMCERLLARTHARQANTMGGGS